MYKPESQRIKCILCTPRPIYRSTYRPIYRPTRDRYVGQHIYRHSADISTEICRSTYRPLYRSFVARHSTESGCLIVGRHVDREATAIRRYMYFTDTYLLVTVPCVADVM